MIADAATHHYLWTALLALAPVALGAFCGGLLVGWLLWGLRKRKGEK